MTDIRDQQVELQIERLQAILAIAAARGLKIRTPKKEVCKDLQDVLDSEASTSVEISQAFSRFFAFNPILKAKPEEIGDRLWLARKTLDRLAP